MSFEMTGIKYDSKKPDYSLIPPHALDDVAKVLTYGAQKYKGIIKELKGKHKT